MTPFRLVSRVLPGSVHRVTPSRHELERGVGERATASEVQAAIPVPWRVVARSARGVIEVEQCGLEPLRAVRFSLAGDGLLGLSLPRTVYPGERVRVVVRGSAADGARGAADAMLILRWFQADGLELLWPIAL